MAFLHAVRHMNFDKWALCCPGSGNILFQRRMSFNQRHPCEDNLSYSHSRMPDVPVTRFSPFNRWISILFLFPTPLKPCCQSRVMGSVGGGGNIGIASALPPSFCVLYCKLQLVYGISISYFSCLPGASVSGSGD